MSFEILNKNPQHISPALIDAIDAILKHGEPEMDTEYRLGISTTEAFAKPQSKFDTKLSPNDPGFTM